MNAKSVILARAWLAFGALALLAIVILFQIFKIQTVKSAYWLNMADSLSTKFVDIEGLRGNIYAEDGTMISTSIPIYDIRFDTKAEGLTDSIFRNNVDSLAWYLSDYFKDKTQKQYRKDLFTAWKKGSRYYMLKNGLDHLQLTDIKQFPIFRMGRNGGGLIAEQHSKRIMPFGSLALRTIGRISTNEKLIGIEGAFNENLTARSGKRLKQKVAGGEWIPINEANELEPKDGQDIITTLDINYQDAAEAALRKQLDSSHADHGCVIVMEVKTGKIKAIANLGRKSKKDSTYSEVYNYAVGERSEPGSTFKLVSAMALLEAGVKPETEVNTTGGKTTFFGDTMKDSHKGGYGTISFFKAFEESSNVGISKLCYSTFSKTPSKFTDFIYSLKINRKTGIEIGGELTPNIKNPASETWSGTSLPWMSVGYEVEMSPLQILTIYNAVANNGQMVKPRLVAEIKETGKTITKYEPEIINPEICSKSTLEQIKKMLEGVVLEGTASKIKTDMYTIAGKTGTAVVADESRGYNKHNKSYKASFCGYFPANNPQYSCIVVVNNPSKGSYYGASVAAPVFREIADIIYANTATVRSNHSFFGDKKNEQVPVPTATTFKNLKTLISPYHTTYAINNVPSGWIRANKQDSAVTFSEQKLYKNSVPNVAGMSLSDALYVLEKSGLRVRFAGHGKVQKQSIPPGARIAGNTWITIEMI